MGLSFFNQRRIQEKKLRQASIGAIETDSHAGDVLSTNVDREDTSSVQQKTTEEVKVKSKPQTKKAKTNKAKEV